jgi:hypothetical protein
MWWSWRFRWLHWWQCPNDLHRLSMWGLRWTSWLSHAALVVARLILEVIHIVTKETVWYKCIRRDIFLLAIRTLMILWFKQHSADTWIINMLILLTSHNILEETELPNLWNYKIRFLSLNYSLKNKNVTLNLSIMMRPLILTHKGPATCIPLQTDAPRQQKTKTPELTRIHARLQYWCVQEGQTKLWYYLYVHHLHHHYYYCYILGTLSNTHSLPTTITVSTN